MLINITILMMKLVDVMFKDKYLNLYKTQNHLKQPGKKVDLCYKIVAVLPSLSFRLTDAWVHYGIEIWKFHEVEGWPS